MFTRLLVLSKGNLGNRETKFNQHAIASLRLFNKMNPVIVILNKISPDQKLSVNIKKQNKYLNHKLKLLIERAIFSYVRESKQVISTLVSACDRVSN